MTPAGGPSGAPPAGGPILLKGLRARLVLVRHGQSTFVAEGRFQGRLDPPLSQLGEQQATLAGSWLGHPDGPPGLGLQLPVQRIVHSPLSRAARTAELIAAAMAHQLGTGQPRLRADDALVEIGQGDWEGRTMAEVSERWGDLLAEWRRSPTTAWAPGGEPLADADLRVRTALGGILAELAPSEAAGPSAARAAPWVIVVAHDGILRLLLLALLDLPLERFWSFPFTLGGATVVELRGGRAHLAAHNVTGRQAAAERTRDDGPGADGPAAAEEVEPAREGAF